MGLRIPPYCVITDVHSVGLSQAFGPEQLTKREFMPSKVVNKPLSI